MVGQASHDLGATGREGRGAQLGPLRVEEEVDLQRLARGGAAHTRDHGVQHGSEGEHAALGEIGVVLGGARDDDEAEQVTQVRESRRVLDAETVAGELGQVLLDLLDVGHGGGHRGGRYAWARTEQFLAHCGARAGPTLS